MANAPKKMTRPILVERRRHPRCTVSACRGRIEASLLQRVRGIHTGGYLPVVNISRGGMMLLGTKPFKVGTTFHLRVDIDGFLTPMGFRMKVIWTAKVNGKKIYQIGVQILKADNGSLDQLEMIANDPYFRYSNGNHKKKT